MDSNDGPLQGAPRHLRKPRFYAAAPQPKFTGNPPGDRAGRPDSARPAGKGSGVSHPAKRRIALAIIMITVVAVAALILALVLWI